MTEKKSISECKIELRGAIKGSKLQIYRIGEGVDLSIEAHKRSELKVSHKDWFIENFGNDIGYSTAMKYRKIYKTCVGHSEWVLTFSLSTLQDLCANNCPEDLRQYLFENGNPDIPNKSYKQVIQGVKDGIYDLKSPEVQALCRFDEKRTDFVERKKVDRSLMVEIRNYRASAISMSEKVEKSSLSEGAKRSVKQSSEKNVEQYDFQLDTFKNDRNEPEFHLPQEKPNPKENSRN